MSVISPEVFIHHVSPLSELHWRKISKTWSSPFLYNPQTPRVPPLHHLETELESSSPSPASVSHHILYPSEAHFSSVHLDVPVKMVILGSKQVGKSALALRYLTKNQCDNNTEGKDGQREGRQRSPTIAVEVEILDIKPMQSNKMAEFESQLKSCDAIIVMYSLTDRVSFHVAREILDDLASLQNITCPVLLLANKMDLCHHRKVSVSEGRELSRAFTQDIMTFYEVSVAHCPEDIMRIFTRLLQSISNSKADLDHSLVNHHRLLHPKEEEDIKNPIMPDHVSRSRKPSVFCVAGRMLNNLMGRNSMPPELPSNSVSKSNPSSPVSQSDGVFSFKKVFKKRSV